MVQKGKDVLCYAVGDITVCRKKIRALVMNIVGLGIIWKYFLPSTIFLSGVAQDLFKKLFIY